VWREVFVFSFARSFLSNPPFFWRRPGPAGFRHLDSEKRYRRHFLTVYRHTFFSLPPPPLLPMIWIPLELSASISTRSSSTGIGCLFFIPFPSLLQSLFPICLLIFFHRYLRRSAMQPASWCFGFNLFLKVFSLRPRPSPRTDFFILSYGPSTTDHQAHVGHFSMRPGFCTRILRRVYRLDNSYSDHPRTW